MHQARQGNAEADKVVRIPLWRWGRIVAHAIVDPEFAHLSDRRWRLGRGYAICASGERGRHLAMHRIVLGLNPGDGLVGDHVNGDTLDNRRCNLRACTNRENQQNRRGAASHSSSGLRGACLGKNGRWRAFVGGKYIGNFPSASAAAQAAAAKRAELGFLCGAAGGAP